MLVDVFSPEFRNPKNMHLRNFFVILPPLVRLEIHVLGCDASIGLICSSAFTWFKVNTTYSLYPHMTLDWNLFWMLRSFSKSPSLQKLRVILLWQVLMILVKAFGWHRSTQGVSFNWHINMLTEYMQMKQTLRTCFKKLHFKICSAWTFNYVFYSHCW